MSARDHHPEVSQLVAYGQGRLAAAEAEQIEAHLLHCMSCCDRISSAACEDRLAQLAREVYAVSKESEASETFLAATRLESPDNSRTGHPSGNRPGANQAILRQIGQEVIPPELRDHPRYRIQKMLGRGGMGVVWLAEHQMMRRLVALKVINSQFTFDRAAVERFHQEVRTAAKLNHPNIVAAFDADQAGHLHFLVMEYVEGLSLSEHVHHRGPLTIDLTLDILRQVCSGLGHAHSQGMVHRDIKPQNLMLSRDGSVRILDFGLARLAVPEGPVSPTAKTEVQLTSEGMILGTPDFMSPEQANDPGSADPGSDIYSLGCTLFFLLTGRRPFENCSFEQMLSTGIRGRIASLKTFRPDTPPALIRLIQRMTAEDPKDRIRTAEDVLREIDAWHSSSLKPVSPELPPVRLREKREARVETPRHQSTDPVPPQNGRRPRTLPRTSSSGSRSGGSTPVSRVSTQPLLRRVTLVSTVVLLILAFGLWFRRDWNRSSQDVALNSPAESGPRPGLVAPAPSPNPSSIRPNASQAGNQRPRILFLVPASDFYWMDVGPLTRLLTEAGCNVVMASWSSHAAVLNNAGPPVPVPLQLEDVDPDDFDAIVIGGGPGILHLTTPSPEADKAENLIRRLYDDGKLITALNAGPGVLARMSLLDGRQATGNPLLSDQVFSEYGVTLTHSDVEVSGSVITGRDNQSHTVSLFAAAIVQKLGQLSGSESGTQP